MSVFMTSASGDWLYLYLVLSYRSRNINDLESPVSQIGDPENNNTMKVYGTTPM